MQQMQIWNLLDRTEILISACLCIHHFCILWTLMSHFMHVTLHLWSKCVLSVLYVIFCGIFIVIWSLLSFPSHLRFGHITRMAAARSAPPGRHPGHATGRRDQGLSLAGAGPGGGVPVHWPGGRRARTAFPVCHLYLLPGLSALFTCFATTSCQQSW